MATSTSSYAQPYYYIQLIQNVKPLIVALHNPLNRQPTSLAALIRINREANDAHQLLKTAWKRAIEGCREKWERSTINYFVDLRDGQRLGSRYEATVEQYHRIKDLEEEMEGYDFVAGGSNTGMSAVQAFCTRWTVEEDRFREEGWAKSV